MSRANDDVDVDLGRLFSSIAANWVRILLIALVVTGLAFALAWFATPKYKAETRLLIETRESVFTRPDAQERNPDAILDQEGVTSQVEVITSTDLLKQVAGELNLAQHAEFEAKGELSLPRRLLLLVGIGSDPNEIPPEERVLKAFREKLNVYRVDNSRVIVIEFSSVDPKLAADVANRLADAYIANQRAAKLQSNSDATEWLGPEIEDLRQRVKDAEARVADYRSKSDLLIGQNNTVLSTQQLSELSQELSRVRASRSAAEATAESVRAALRDGTSVENLPSVLESPLIQRLRERQVQLKADIADLSTSLLGNHPRIRALNSQLADLDQQITAEARKVLAGLETQAQTARFRERQLVADLNQLKAESARAGNEEVELRALEREATAQRELLESYLTRFREASSRSDRNYLPADARIFSRAIAPSEPYFPKVLPITIAAFVASLLLMAIFTMLAELFSGRAMRPAYRPLSEPADYEDEPEPRPAAVHVAPEPVAVVVPEPVVAAQAPEPAAPAEPRMSIGDELKLAFSKLRGDAEKQAASDIVTETVEQPKEPPSPPVARPAWGGIEKLAWPKAEPVSAPVEDMSGSGGIDVAEAAEQLIVSGKDRAIFLSPEGDEAAASAVLVAREIADAGMKVVLLDLTSSGAASIPMLESRNYPGITNLLCSEVQFTDVIHGDLYSDCHIVPVGTANAGRAMRAAERLPMILDSLNTAYDMVIVECGPADPSALGRLESDRTEVVLSVLDAKDRSVLDAEKGLDVSGYRDAMKVTPSGHLPPKGRSVA
jgi:uncharacterized protein involved in exopolysaccharide biosynthesis/Mrp family chromosome partitioning ATPase